MPTSRAPRTWPSTWAKLSANLLMPQMAKGDEDQADALGFDLLVKAGYDPEAPLAVMDKLAEQEAEAAAAAQSARDATKKDGGGSSGSLLDKVGGSLDKVTAIATGNISTEQAADIAIFAFDSAVDSMADDATTHHPAKERADLLSAYLFSAYRDVAPGFADAAPLGAGQQVAAQAEARRAARALYRRRERRRLYRRQEPGHRGRSPGAGRARDGGADRRSRLYRLRPRRNITTASAKPSCPRPRSRAPRTGRSLPGKSIRGWSTSISRGATTPTRRP